jgi:hypothetical protein
VVDWTLELAQRLWPGEATCEIAGIRGADGAAGGGRREGLRNED